jgi:hypothetical protein
MRVKKRKEKKREEIKGRKGKRRPLARLVSEASRDRAPSSE